MAKKNFTEFLSFISVIIIIWLLVDQDDKKKKITELETALKTNANISDDIKNKLKELVKAKPNIQQDVAEELDAIHELIDIQQDSKAILSMAKIIETQLKKYYKNDATFQAQMGKRKPTFEDHLNYAYNHKLISKEHYHQISLIKLYRNEEAHELAVKNDKSKLFASFTAGLHVINMLDSLLVGA